MPPYPSPLVEKVMSKPELELLNIDFETALNSAIKLMIKGAH